MEKRYSSLTNLKDEKLKQDNKIYFFFIYLIPLNKLKLQIHEFSSKLELVL